MFDSEKYLDFAGLIQEAVERYKSERNREEALECFEKFHHIAEDFTGGGRVWLCSKFAISLDKAISEELAHVDMLTADIAAMTAERDAAMKGLRECECATCKHAKDYWAPGPCDMCVLCGGHEERWQWRGPDAGGEGKHGTA